MRTQLKKLENLIMAKYDCDKACSYATTLNYEVGNVDNVKNIYDELMSNMAECYLNIIITTSDITEILEKNGLIEPIKPTDVTNYVRYKSDTPNDFMPTHLIKNEGKNIALVIVSDIKLRYNHIILTDSVVNRMLVYDIPNLPYYNLLNYYTQSANINTREYVYKIIEQLDVIIDKFSAIERADFKNTPIQLDAFVLKNRLVCEIGIYNNISDVDLVINKAGYKFIDGKLIPNN